MCCSGRRTLQQCWTDAELPHLPAGVGGREGELEEWITNYYKMVSNVMNSRDFAHIRYLDLEIETDPTQVIRYELAS